MSHRQEDVFAAALRCHTEGQAAVLVTLIGVGGSAPRAPGARMLVTSAGRIAGTIGGGNAEHRAIALATAALGAHTPSRVTLHLQHDLGMCCGGTMELFIDPLPAPSQLVVFGAGHVGSALAPIALQLGFDVTVVDARPDWADPERLPGCTVRCEDPLRWLEAAPLRSDAFFLVVTHDHALDQDLIERLLPRESAWVGLIASRAKVARFRTRLCAAGMDEQLFERLSSPVGLAIGAQTPVEIAISIAAQLVQRRHQADL